MCLVLCQALWENQGAKNCLRVTLEGGGTGGHRTEALEPFCPSAPTATPTASLQQGHCPPLQISKARSGEVLQ